MNRFAIDESKLAHWLDTELSGAGELDIDPTWNPQDYGQETSVYDLVRQAHGQVIIPPQDMRVSFCYRDDSDGGCYCWLVDIAAGLHGLRLASAFEEMRRLVPDERVGREAAESILREAVEQANGCLAALVRHTGLRGAAETDAVIAETTIERSITPEPDGDDAGWLAGVADGLAWVLGQDASDDMRRLARAALARAGDQAIAANSQPRPGLDVATLAPAQQTRRPQRPRRQPKGDPVNSPIATVGELIAALQDFDEGAPVRLAFQPSWPFEHACGQVAADSGGTVWIAEGAQIGYLPGPARHALDW